MKSRKLFSGHYARQKTSSDLLISTNFSLQWLILLLYRIEINRFRHQKPRLDGPIPRLFWVPGEFRLCNIVVVAYPAASMLTL